MHVNIFIQFKTPQKKTFILTQNINYTKQTHAQINFYVNSK